MCRVFNATQSDLILRKNAKLSTAERISCNAIHELNGTEMPGREARKNTFEELGINLDNADLNANQKEELKNLINEYGDIFARRWMI